MAGGGGKNGGSLYAVLGVASDCSDAELRSAYRKLAMKWHPDKCAAAGSSGGEEAAKARFQKIQGAYAVLSDPNKRILYDVGPQQTGPHENGKGESLEDLQRQFEELFLRPDAYARSSKPSSSFCSGQDESGKSSKIRRAGRK